jgi:hypothetical protein
LAPPLEVKAQSDMDDDMDTKSMESKGSNFIVLEEDYLLEGSSDDNDSLN